MLFVTSEGVCRLVEMKAGRIHSTVKSHFVSKILCALQVTTGSCPSLAQAGVDAEEVSGLLQGAS